MCVFVCVFVCVCVCVCVCVYRLPHFAPFASRSKVAILAQSGKDGRRARKIFFRFFILCGRKLLTAWLIGGKEFLKFLMNYKGIFITNRPGAQEFQDSAHACTQIFACARKIFRDPAILSRVGIISQCDPM